MFYIYKLSIFIVKLEIFSKIHIMKEKEAFLELYTIRKNNLYFKFNFRLIEKNILEKVSSEINFIYYFENI